MSDKNTLYFEWDVENWSKALPFWEEAIEGKKYQTALELGSRNGGLSLWLAQNYNLKVTCTDLSSPEATAYKLHQNQKLLGEISYKSANILQLDFEDASFDIVIFKSVLGALATYENQQVAMKEIFRVLKPGGVFLFAENIKSSYLHQIARRLFVPWAHRWRYLNISEMETYLHRYSFYQYNTAGFLSVFLPNSLKALGANFDNFLDRRNLIPRRKYIIFGYGIK